MHPKDRAQMMAYLTRPGRNRNRQFLTTQLVDDLEPGSLKDELLKDFDPSQETYEEYLQRKNLERPFNMADGGRIGFANGTTSKTQTKTFKYPKKYYNARTKKVETVYSKKPPVSQVGFVSKANIAKSEKALQPFIDKFGIDLLNKMAKSQYGKNFRELDRVNELKFFKRQINKYEDFILKNKRYPTTSEAYRIGLKQSGKKPGLSPGKEGITGDIKKFVDKTYSKAIGGSTYIAKKLKKPPYNFKITSSQIREYINEEIEAGRLKKQTKFQTTAADPTLPKDRYNIVREVTDKDLKGFTVGRTGTKVLAPEGSKYKISFKASRTPETTKVPTEYQGTQYYKSKAQAESALKGYQKFSKDLKKAGEAGRSLREIILRQISDPNIEAAIGRMKEGEDLATAHRLSYKQVGKLGQLYNIANLGIEDPAINSGAIRKFENKLERLYEEQRNLIKTAKRSTNKGLPVPKNLQEKIDLNNKKISTVVDLTNQRVQGVLIDTKTLKPSTYGINYIKTYGMGLLKNKNVKDITDADLDLIELNVQNQINRENKLGAKTESFLRDRQELLKYVDDLVKPGFLSKIPAKLRPLALGTGLTIGGISAVAADDAQAADGTEAKSILPTAAAGAAAAGTIGTKPGRKLLGKAFRTLGTRAASIPLAGLTVAENIRKGENIADAVVDPLVGLELSFPGLFKENVAKITTNPTAQKLLNLGRFARLTTPVGLGITAAGLGIDAAKFTRDRIRELQAMTPEQRQQLRAEQSALAFEGARDGGLIGKKSGPPPISGPTPHGDEGLPAAFKNVRKR